MSQRKPLDPGCKGGIFCPAKGHVVSRRFKNGRVNISHVPLTQGQRQALREQAPASRA